MKIYEALDLTTRLLRVGAEVTTEDRGELRVTTIDAMPPATDAQPDETVIDCVLVKVAVHDAEAAREAVEKWLSEYPQQDRLRAGVSYIELGAVIGDQGAAFQLYALGEVLGLWKVMTPMSVGITGKDARELAGLGMVYIEGYDR